MKDAVSLYREFQKIRLNIDKVNTPYLSKIKEIIKRIHFADIVNDQQVLDNKGDAYYKIYERDEGRTFKNLTLSYTVTPKKTGVVYGLFKEETDKEGNKKVVFNDSGKANHFTSYGRFLADVTSHKIIYSKELECFIAVGDHAYKVLDEVTFSLEYPIESKHKIPDFLSVMETIYRDLILVKTHAYKVYPYKFSGTDWFFDCKELQMYKQKPAEKELFFAYFEVDYQDLDFEMPKKFLGMVADGEHSFNNLSLLHAYVLFSKLNLVPAEYSFIMKDFGRTGKGLFMNTFPEVFKVNKVNFDSLTSGGFEANNEWFKFYGCDLAHANETGEIDKKNMRVIRKISTHENVTGREIGKNGIGFQITAVLVLDTNEDVNIREITANRSRVVKISFKDRPFNETAEERHQVFKPYWDFVQPEHENSLKAGVSFLVNSLDYLKKKHGKFSFDEVTLRYYFSSDELTETQKILIIVIDENGFILAGDEELQKAIENDYGSLRYQKAKDDIRKIGVKINQQKWIDGKNFKVHLVGDKKLFNQVLELLKDSKFEIVETENLDMISFVK